MQIALEDLGLEGYGIYSSCLLNNIFDHPNPDMENNFEKTITYKYIGGINSTSKDLERETILKSYRRLYHLGSWQETSSNKYFLKLLKKAFRFILEVYQEPGSNFRPDALFHAIEIAVITAEKFRLGAKSITCVLLHDTINTQKASELDLRKAFGRDITAVVRGLSKVSGITDTGSTNESSKLRYVLTYFSPDNCLIVLIKFAEYLHKMYIIHQFRKDKQIQIAEEAHKIYIPLAHHLGVANVYLELEDLYLKFKHTIVYDSILKKVKATKTAPAGFLESFAESISEALKKQGAEFVIKGRTKSVSSICHKIKERNIPFEEIHDFYGLRIVFDCPIEDEYGNCWAIYEIITKLYEPKLTNLRDWISYPKESGYEALHITVMSPEGQWVEIQIRAKRMDDKAEHGDAAHWKYKSNTLGKEFDKMDKNWLEKARKFLSSNANEEKHKHVSVSVNKIYVVE